VSLLAQQERLTRRVGAITLFLLVAAIAFFVFVAGRIEWGERVRLQVFFRNTGGLREGAPIIVAGRAIGSVESIAPAPHGVARTWKSRCPSARVAAPASDEGVIVTIELDADEAGRIACGGDVFVSGRGPLSARHLELAPSADPDGPALADGDQVLGIDPPTLDRVLQRTWDNLTTAKKFADEVGPEFEALRVQLRQLATTMDGLVPNVVGVASLGFELDGLLAEVRQLREVALGGDAGLERLGLVIGRARATIAQARRMLDVLGDKATRLTASVDAVRGRFGERGPAAVRAVELAIDRVRAAMDKIDPLLAKLEDLNARIARGEGSIGRLAQDPEFPEDAKELGKILKRQPWRIFARPKD
jgi:hypothetical protein